MQTLLDKCILTKLYPANSVPAVVKRINQALQRADQIDHAEGREEDLTGSHQS